MLAAAVLIGFARVYSGIHYPGDIAGSAVISALAGLIVRAVLHRIPSRPGSGKAPVLDRASDGVAPAVVQPFAQDGPVRAPTGS